MYLQNRRIVTLAVKINSIKMWKVKNRVSIALPNGHHMILGMNTGYLPKQHQPADLFNWGAGYFVRGRS
jgi:hypothetical protein